MSFASSALNPMPASLLQAWTDVLELLPDAVFIVDSIGDGGRVSYVNSQASRMFGYEQGELVGQSIDILVPHALRDRHIQHRHDYAQSPKLRTMGAGLELRGRRRDGSEFPIDVLLKPRDNHPASGTIAIVRDMTDRQNLEDALRQARDAAVKANEVKSRFLAAASHDLRQPLQTIWSLQAVLSRAFKDTEYGPHLALLEEAARTMDQTLSSLIDINRLEQGAIQPVIRDFSLREILSRLRSEFTYAASNKSLKLEIEDCADSARSDPMLLPVILRNLIGNAIKYTQTGGVRVQFRSQTTLLYIDVIDTGPGIPAEHLERLFDAFYQVDNHHRDQRQGVGLGLSIVQTICRLLDHTVTIDSRVGEGSVFTLQLTRGEPADAAPSALPPAAALAATPVNARKVLHIEDDPGVARSMAMLLRVEGYQVIGAASRDEAVRQVADHGVRPDLILCDFQLPMGFTGDEIVAELAALLKCKPPTIMLTGDISDQHLQKARTVADRILPKPVDLSVLLREMQSLIGD